MVAYLFLSIYFVLISHHVYLAACAVTTNDFIVSHGVKDCQFYFDNDGFDKSIN